MYGLLFSHFIGDFLCQTNWMATTKSRNIWALLIHCTVYTVVILLYSCLQLENWFVFSITQGSLHFLIDFITSKLTTYFWHKSRYRLFFNTIGLDQLLHTFCLLYFGNLFGGN
jgi:hypothetical protein